MFNPYHPLFPIKTRPDPRQTSCANKSQKAGNGLRDKGHNRVLSMLIAPLLFDHSDRVDGWNGGDVAT